MKEILKNKKEFIIDCLIDNPMIDPYELSLKSNISYHYVEKVVREYNKSITLNHPIYFVESLGMLGDGVFFIFSCGEEKVIDTNKKDYEHLTPYEKYWLLINKNIDTDARND